MPQYIEDVLGPKHLANLVLELRNTLDFSPILQSYPSDRGQPGYHPVMMTLLLVYAYAVGVQSSRKISRLCESDLGFRLISGGAKPDHDTICAFRVRHLESFKALFLETIELAKGMGLVRLGHVAVDGSKFEANASKHKAMSFGRMAEAKEKLRQEVDRLLQEAEEIDAAEDRLYGKGRRGDELPEEWRDAQQMREAIRRAHQKLKEAAKKRELAEEKQRRVEQIEEAEEALKEEARSKAKEQGRPVEEAMPEEKAQRNFTDPESRILPKNKKTFVQGYNAQIAVEAGTQLIVGQGVIQATNDKNQLSPMIEQVEKNTGEIPVEVSADSGYLSEPDIQKVAAKGIEVFVATGRLAHGAPPPPARGRMPAGLSLKDRMARKLRTKKGRASYARRKVTVEPTYGQIKNRGFRRFSLRGLRKAQGEFSLVCAVHNLVKLFTLNACLAPG